MCFAVKEADLIFFFITFPHLAPLVGDTAAPPFQDDIATFRVKGGR